MVFAQVFGRLPLRRWLLVAALLALGGAVLWHGWPRDPFRQQIAAFLREEGIGGVVVAHGAAGSAPVLFAMGEAAPGRRMRAGDSFRLASLAKPVTAAAVLQLVEDGRLTLDTPVAGAGPGITVRHLLHHSGGWDRDISFDPIGNPETIGRIGITPPYRCEDVAARMPPAQFAPGTRHAYSNIGYCWLGRVIGQAAGMAYEEYVQRHVLTPRGAALVWNGEPDVHHPGNWPDSAHDALGPGGGWTGTARDYWAFAAGPVSPHVTERPAYAPPGRDYYGLGWRVWPDGTLSHFGTLPGAFTIVIRKGDRVAVLLFNGRPVDDKGAFRRIRAMVAAGTGI